MKPDKYIYTLMGSIVSSACICNVCTVPQYGFFVIAFVFAGAGVGVQIYADRKREQMEAEERKVAKQIQAMLDSVLKEVSGCVEECRSVNQRIDSIVENQEAGIAGAAKIKEAIDIMSRHMEGGMAELKKAAMEQIKRCDDLLGSSKQQNAQNEKVISGMDKLAKQLSEHKDELCGRIGMYEGMEGVVQEVSDAVSEIKECCIGMPGNIMHEISPLKKEIMEAMENNTEGQDKIVERYDMLTGKINNLIVELGKEASNVVRALSDFYRSVNLKDTMNRRGK